MIKYRKYTENGYIETLEQPDAPYDTIEFDPNEGEAERLAQEKKSKTRQDIISLEAQITNRRMREAMVTGDYKFINDIEKQITELRKELK